MYIQGKELTKNFGTTPVFDKIDLTINPGDKIGLVGHNGCGKSTLLRLLTGEEGLTSGTIAWQKGLTIGYVPQKLAQTNHSVQAYLLDSFPEIEALAQEMRRVEALMADPDNDLERLLSHYGRLQSEYEAAGGYTLEDRITGTMKGLGLGDKLGTLVSDLSGGQRVRVELARVLTTNAQVLLLDEPTNHLDLAGIAWLESYLAHTKQAYLVISHDRQFLDNVTNRILEIEGEELIAYPGNYSRYRGLKAERLAALQKSFDLQQKECQRLKLQIRRYRQWAQEGDNDAFFKKAKELERRLAKLQEQLKNPPQPPKKSLGKLQVAERSGSEVVKAAAIGKFVGDNLLFCDTSFTLYRKERVALVGDNGSGKTTLLRCLTGELALDEGTLTLGANVKVGYLPQKLVFAKPTQRLLEYVEEFLPIDKSRSTLARHGFYAEDVTKRIQDLSGGEQMRLYLLRLLQEQVNFLILDEPTNHLDIYGKEELEELLQGYQETLLVVSHDRYFLRKVCQMRLVIQEGQIQKESF